MKLSDNYIKSDAESIIAYAKKMRGKTFEDILDDAKAYEDGIPNTEELSSMKNKYRKGGLGNLIEKYYFGYDINSNPDSDFSEANLELKVTPYEISQKKKGEPTYRAGERLVLTMIDFSKPISVNEKTLQASHVWAKCARMLLVYYHRIAELKAQKRNLEYPIDFVYFLNLCQKCFAKDVGIMTEDYNKIIGKILAGKAHEISEGDTLYLGACTKGSTAAKSFRIQFYPDKDDGEKKLAKSRAFCLKQSYMTYLLNQYIRHEAEAESIFQDSLPAGMTFEAAIKEKLKPYIGWSAEQIAAHFNFDLSKNKNKSKYAFLVYKILGIKGNQAEEFQKANITIRTIALEENGRLKEDISFSAFSFLKIAEETWEDSWVNTFFSENRFFVVVFQKAKDKETRILRGGFFWNVPEPIIEGPMKECWTKTQKAIVEGVELHWDAEKGIMSNNLPKKKQNPVMHVRPHTSKRYYDLGNGRIYGNGTPANAAPLPDGRLMQRQGFFLNASFMIKVIHDHIGK